jgi:hypothetical protein
VTPTVPPIDRRTATDIARDVQDLAAIYAPSWQEIDPATGRATGAGGALVGAFARFAEIVVQRLNQVPHKNFLGFLELLGASRLPPQSARVPLTFSLAAGTVVDARVPAGTQAAAPPAAGEKAPVIFETERELSVTAATLASVFVRDPERDLFADHTALTGAASIDGGRTIFQGERRVEHTFYIGQRGLLGFPAISAVRLAFVVTPRTPDTRVLVWEFWDGTTWVDHTPLPANDQTQSLRQSGTINFGAASAIPLTSVNGIENRWIRCRLITPISRADVAQAGMERAGQLPIVDTIGVNVEVNEAGLAGSTAFTNLSPVDVSKEFFPFGEKPKFGDTFAFAHSSAFAQAGALITLPIVLTNPSTGTPGTVPPPVKPSSDLVLRWEVWQGTRWLEMGTTTPAGPRLPIANEFVDTTRACTLSGQVGFRLPPGVATTTVNGVEGSWVRARIIAGNYGVEARYDPVDPNDPAAGFKFSPATFAPPVISTITITQNLTRSAGPDAVLTFSDGEFADVTLAARQGSAATFAPFRPAVNVETPASGETDGAACYLGFTLPAQRTSFPNRPISLLCQVAASAYGDRTVPFSPDRSEEIGLAGSIATHTFSVTNSAAVPAQLTFTVLGTRWVPAPAAPAPIALEAGETRDVTVSVPIPAAAPLGERDRGFLRFTTTADPSAVDRQGIEPSATFVTIAGAETGTDDRVRLAWEYWNGRDWSPLVVRDDSFNFTRPGIVEFLPPPDIASRQEFGLPPRFWLRVRHQSGEFTRAPRLTRLLLNTTMAVQAVTIRDERLGSSDGSARQEFRATQKPILLDQQLQVREAEMPSAAELETITREEGADAVAIVPEVTGRPDQIWVRWHEVPDTYGSGPRDRHYVLDHLAGVVRFGDGVNGLIPPVGAGNVRLARYRVGGGSAGNKAAETIVQLKTTVPYVDKVSNREPAAGGADAETTESVIARVPRSLRHHGRAVTIEDYEDLAMLASPAVARARCIPLRNLDEDPLGERPIVRGEVSVIVVPRTNDAKPQPSLELMARVQDHLAANSVPTAHISVVGALYVRVQVNATIALTSLDVASAVEEAVQTRLAAFLHPLTGGLDAAGWDFGRKPHRSDLFALIESVPGVDHLRALVVEEIEDRPGVTATGRFLVYSGRHTIGLVLEEE